MKVGGGVRAKVFSAVGRKNDSWKERERESSEDLAWSFDGLDSCY